LLEKWLIRRIFDLGLNFTAYYLNDSTHSLLFQDQAPQHKRTFTAITVADTEATTLYIPQNPNHATFDCIFINRTADREPNPADVIVLISVMYNDPATHDQVKVEGEPSHHVVRAFSNKPITNVTQKDEGMSQRNQIEQILDGIYGVDPKSTKRFQATLNKEQPLERVVNLNDAVMEEATMKRTMLQEAAVDKATVEEAASKKTRPKKTRSKKATMKEAERILWTIKYGDVDMTGSVHWLALSGATREKIGEGQYRYPQLVVDRQQLKEKMVVLFDEPASPRGQRPQEGQD